jgi:hypothetical protein
MPEVENVPDTSRGPRQDIVGGRSAIERTEQQRRIEIA